MQRSIETFRNFKEVETFLTRDQNNDLTETNEEIINLINTNDTDRNTVNNIMIQLYKIAYRREFFKKYAITSLNINILNDYAYVMRKNERGMYIWFIGKTNNQCMRFFPELFDEFNNKWNLDGDNELTTYEYFKDNKNEYIRDLSLSFTNIDEYGIMINNNILPPFRYNVELTEEILIDDLIDNIKAVKILDLTTNPTRIIANKIEYINEITRLLNDSRDKLDIDGNIFDYINDFINNLDDNISVDSVDKFTAEFEEFKLNIIELIEANSPLLK